MKIVTIYTDGACSNNQERENIGGWGAILEYQDNLKELFGSDLNTTNNRMEMMAVIAALGALRTKDLRVEIYSDSAYLVNCFRERWYDKWRLSGWLTASKKPVENRDLWEILLPSAESFRSVEFFKIKGHLDLSKPADVRHWKKKIEETNGRTYTDLTFRHLLEMNHRADALANKGIDEARSALKQNIPQG